MHRSISVISLPSIGFIAAVMVISSLLLETVSAGCLREDGQPLCCLGRDNTCLSKGPRLKGNDSKLCYCDELCISAGDCCSDFPQACLPVDCKLADWTEWGNCSALCGRGVMTRTRPILVQPRNGGEECQQYLERLPCWGTKCKVSRATLGGNEEARETGRIIPAGFGVWRQHKKYDPYKDYLRRNLYRKYHLKQNTVLRPTYYGLYEIVRSSPSCGQLTGPEWSRNLQKNGTVCVECQQFAMRRHIGTRCRGHGLPKRETRWEATTAPGCRGTWILQSQHEEGTCNGDSQLSFIFV